MWKTPLPKWKRTETAPFTSRRCAMWEIMVGEIALHLDSN